ncbi:SDR family NAD(P)-dependent oxidoreductase [Sorangium sp. So ce887]
MRRARHLRLEKSDISAIRADDDHPMSGPFQAMLPLLREAPAARIVNVSSGTGSLTMNADPTFPWRSMFSPVYPASKTALNAMTLAMAIELESTGIKVNAASPGFTRTNLNNQPRGTPRRRLSARGN